MRTPKLKRTWVVHQIWNECRVSRGFCLYYTASFAVFHVMAMPCGMLNSLFIFSFSSMLKTNKNNGVMTRRERMCVVWVPVALVGSILNNWKSQCGLMARKSTRDVGQNLQPGPMGAVFCNTNHHLIMFAKITSHEKDTPLSPGPVSLSQDVALPTVNEPLGPPQTFPDSCRRFW